MGNLHRCHWPRRAEIPYQRRDFGADDGTRTRDPHLGKKAVKALHLVLLSPVSSGLSRQLSVQTPRIRLVVERSTSGAATQWLLHTTDLHTGYGTFAPGLVELRRRLKPPSSLSVSGWATHSFAFHGTRRVTKRRLRGRQRPARVQSTWPKNLKATNTSAQETAPLSNTRRLAMKARRLRSRRATS